MVYGAKYELLHRQEQRNVGPGCSRPATGVDTRLAHGPCAGDDGLVGLARCAPPGFVLNEGPNGSLAPARCWFGSSLSPLLRFDSTYRGCSCAGAQDRPALC